MRVVNDSAEAVNQGSLPRLPAAPLAVFRRSPPPSGRRIMKKPVKDWGIRLLRALFGVRLRDQRTGLDLGKVLVIPWKGGLRFIGLEGAAVRPSFLPQESEQYWAQDLGFSSHPPPDFPHVANHDRSFIPPNGSGSGENASDVGASES